MYKVYRVSKKIFLNFLCLRRMKNVLSMQNSSVPYVRVRQPGSFLERAAPSYHGAGPGLALRDRLGYTQMFLKGQKKFFQRLSFSRASHLFQPSFFFPAAEEAVDEFEEKTLVPLKVEFWISWPHSVMCHALEYVSRHRFLPSHQMCYFKAKNIIAAYIRIYCIFLTLFPLREIIYWICVLYFLHYHNFPFQQLLNMKCIRS